MEASVPNSRRAASLPPAECNIFLSDKTSVERILQG